MTIAISRFSTADLRPQDRHEAWRRRGWPHVSAVLDAKPTEPFDTWSDRYALGEVVVQHGRMTAQDYARDRARICADGVEQLLALFCLEGHMAGNANGRSFATGPGEIQLLDMATPHVHVSSASHTLLVSIPRTSAIARGIDPAALHGTVIGANDAALATTYLCALNARAATIRQSRAATLGATILDLLEVGIEDAGLIPVAGATAAETAAATAAHAYIEEHLSVPTLSADTVAAALRISRTTLYRLFMATGGVASHIRQRRLDRVRDALASGTPGSLADIAAPWGFTDASHFGRLFRARYGMAPGDYREQFGHGR